MSYEKQPAVRFPGDFDSKGDSIIVTGELEWTYVQKDHLKDGDDRYTCSIRIPEKEYKKLQKMKPCDGRKLCGLKKVMKKDEDGDETDEVDYYRITMAQNTQIKNKSTGEMEDVEIPVRMYNDKKNQVTKRIGNGSKGSVKGTLYISDYETKKQCSLNLAVIQLWTLEEYEQKGAFDDFDFDDDAGEDDPFSDMDATEADTVDSDDDEDDVPFA